MKVEIFTSTLEQNLENSINEWIVSKKNKGNLSIIDMKYSIATGALETEELAGCTVYSVLILYKER